MNRLYRFILCLGLLALSAPTVWAADSHRQTVVASQDDDYDPQNPGNPQTPAEKYMLSLKASPASAASFNIGTSEKVEVGYRQWIRAYNNGSYYFQYWANEKGDTLSESAGFYYTMPQHDATLTAVYKFNPTSPGNPEQKLGEYTLLLNTEPANAGYFNWDNGQKVEEGSYVSLYAYANSGYRFRELRQNDSLVGNGNRYSFYMPTRNVSVTAIFDYNPSSPTNPGKNYWNQLTGEVIVDDFTPGNLYDAIYNLLGGQNDKVSTITVVGKVNSYDWSIANNFSTCSLVDMSRTTGLDEVPQWAFEGASNLTSVILPASISRIGSYAFYNCTSLQSISCHAVTPPTIGYSAFYGVNDGLVVYVPADALTLYQDADGWKNFTLMPLEGEVKTLEVNLPEGCDPKLYKDMFLELVNVKSGQRLRYVITDRVTYTFNSLIKNTTYNAYLKNKAGDVLGQIDNIEIIDQNVAVTFDSLKEPKTIRLRVLIPDGNDVTAQTNITWTDQKGTFLARGSEVGNQLEGNCVNYRITLPQALAMAYMLPVETSYAIQQAENVVTVTLEPIAKRTIGGQVTDIKTGLPIKGAQVILNQMVHNVYSKSTSTKTDADGKWQSEVYDFPLELSAQANNYISQSLSISSLDEWADGVVPTFELKDINGTTIQVMLTYKDANGESQGIYSDYANVQFTVSGEDGVAINELNVQYPQIVMLEEHPAGSRLLVTATSKKGKFMPVTATAIVDEHDQGEVTLEILQLGGIEASFRTTDNQSVVGMLYDANGLFLKRYDYAGTQLDITEIADGEYTLVTMGGSTLFNTIGRLSQFADAGLTEGVDYVKNRVTVKSGEMTAVNLPMIPYLDETKLYYTGNNTSFTVNKTQVTAGQYVTLTGKIDFKKAFATQIADVSLNINLPTDCEFVNNSVMVGNTTGSYTYAEGQVNIPLDNLSDRIRLCVVPTKGGTASLSATVNFTLNGKEMTQPIGNVNFTVEDLSMSVPGTVAKTTFPVSGLAQGKSVVEVYDGDVAVASTTALANGTWTADVKLDNPYNMSVHPLHAKVTTSTGYTMQTETHEVVYNKDAISMKTVTMSFYNGWLRKTINVVFDFETGQTSESSYMFYTGTDLTFVADLTNNDTTVVSSVTLFVYTDKNEIRELQASYDKRMDRWVAVSYFDSNNLPVNLSASFISADQTLTDRGHFDLCANRFDAAKDEAMAIIDSIASQTANIEAQELEATERQQTLDNILTQLESSSTPDEQSLLVASFLKEAGYDVSDSELEPVSPDVVDEQYINLLIENGMQLLSNTDENYDFDKLDAMLTAADSLLTATDEQMDYEASLRTALSDTLTLQTDHGEAIFYRTTLDKLGNIPFEVVDTISVEMTDGSFLYVYMSEANDILIIDSLKQQAWYVNDVEVASEMAGARAMMKASRDEGFVSAMNEARQKIEWLGNTILSAVKAWIGEQNNIRNGLLKQIDDLKAEQVVLAGQSAGKQMRIKDIEKEIKALTKSDVISLDEYFGVVKRDELISQLQAERKELLKQIKKNDKTIASLVKKTGKLTSKAIAVAAVLSELHDLYQVASGLFKTISYVNASIQDYRHWHSLIDNIEPCRDDAAKAAALKERAKADWSNIAWKKGYYPACAITGLSTIVNGYMLTNKAAKVVAKMLVSVITDFMSNTADAMFTQARNASLQWYPRRYAEYTKLECVKKKEPKDRKDPDKPKDPKNPDGSTPKPIFKDVPAIHDPSGYVYEAVSSNRVEGVTASCYYKEMVEDMYGDLHENIVLWNAEEYAQQNPLFTDENGMYQWDVPQGLWQVKFEKEGYQTTYSEWLPVPPPQLDVNIAISQLVQPQVKSGKAYSEGVEIEFDKYMDPTTLNTDNIQLTKNGNKVEGAIVLLNEEVANEDNSQTFASKMRFQMPEGQELLATDEVRLTIRKNVTSYAGVQMESDYIQSFDVLPRIRTMVVDSLVNVAYGGQRTLTIAALPADASKGKTVKVKSLSDMIAKVNVETLTLDENGQAEMTVNGELPGKTVIALMVDDSDIEGMMTVRVKDANDLFTVAPRASRVSGTEVYRGTRIQLTTETEDATIYYTLDGTCPCETGSASVLKYDASQPIVIASDNVTIKAMAKGVDLEDSEVAEFNYSLKKTTLGYQFPEGWTWISHNLETPVPVMTFAPTADLIVSQTDEAIKDPVYGLMGGLTQLEPAMAYKVKVSNSTEKLLDGFEYNPLSKSVTLATGWNWIGYPVSQTMTLDEAFAFFSPMEGDYILGQEGFAEYADGNWNGTLEGLKPGKGYMFKSGKSDDLYFNTTIVSVAASRMNKHIKLYNAPWTSNLYGYPNLMPMTAHLYKDGVMVGQDEYAVGAFAGSECRAIGEWKDGKLLMNIAGERREDISFLAVRLADGRFYEITERVPFVVDNMGSWRLPYALHIGQEATAISNLWNKLTVSPLVFSDYINVDADGRHISNLSLTDISGRVALRADNLGTSAVVTTGSLAPGVYVVTVVADGQTYYKKILKANK